MSTPEPRVRFALFAAGLAISVSFAVCTAAAALIFRERILFILTDRAENLRALAIAGAILAAPIALGALLVRLGTRRGGARLTRGRWVILASVVSLCTVALFVGGWIALYPDPSDAKNLGYVLWKDGYRQMNLDDAVDALVHDPQRDTLLIGKTESELRARLGYLLPPDRADAYERRCASESDWGKGPGERLMFVRDSDLAVVFKNGRTTDYVMMKGC